jgi:hypothetical protein
VHVRVGPDLLVARVPAAGRPQVGAAVRVRAAERDWHVFDADSGLRVRP